jgi:hypothetical protein
MNLSANPKARSAGLEACVTMRGFPKATGQSAFTLLEVILACALFFMFAFAVLELVTRGVNAARAIQQHDPDGSLILAPFSTNRVLEPMSLSGDFEEFYPGVYPGYSWTLDVAPSAQFGDTNPIFEVTVVVTGGTRNRKTIQSVMSTLMFAPDSKLNAPMGGTLGAPR